MLRRKVTTKTNVMHSYMHKILGVLSFVEVSRVLVGKLEVKILLGRPGHRWKDIMNQRGGSGLGLSGSGYGHLAGCCISGIEPSGSMKCQEFFD